MLLLRESAPKLCTNAIYRARAVMSIYAILQFAVLPIHTRIQSSEVGYGFEVFLCSLVIVLEATLVTLGAGSAQIMIITEFVGRRTSFYFIKNGGINSNGLIEAAGTRIPCHLRANRSTLSCAVPGRQ